MRTVSSGGSPTTASSAPRPENPTRARTRVKLRHVAIVAWAGLIALLIALSYALSVGHFASDGGALMENPWGLATVLDVYVGIALFCCWVAWREASAPRAVVWIALIALGGNLISTLYVLLALRASGGEFEKFWHGPRLRGSGSGVPVTAARSEEKRT